MAFKLDWLVEQRVVSLKVWGKITTEENREMNIVLAAMINEGLPPIHLIVTLGEGATVPLGYDPSAVNSSPLRDKRVGRAVLVGATGIIRFLGQVVAMVTKADVRLVDNLEQAYAALLEIDVNLPSIYDEVAI